MPRTTRQLISTPLVVALLAACSSGGGGGGSPQPTANFSGAWALTAIVTSSTCGPLGGIDSLVLTIVQDGANVSISDTDGDFTGTVQGSTAALSRGNDTLMLEMAAGNQSFAGLGSFVQDLGGSSCTNQVTLTARPFQPAATTSSLRFDCDGNFVDSSGNDNHGSASGVRFVAAGGGRVTGQVARFDGTGGVEIEPAPEMLTLPGHPFTIAFWVRPTTSATPQTLWARASENPTVEHTTMALWIDDGSYRGVAGQVVYNEGFGPGPGHNTQNPIPMNEWTHIAFSWDGSYEIEMYVNGFLDMRNTALQGSNEGQHGEGPWPTTLGFSHNESLPGGRFTGDMDEVVYYTRQLTAAEVERLYFEGPDGI